MKFERETNLYQDQALARKFKSQDTEFEIIQGHINAMISESEIRELINGGKTMYSAMNDIKIDVNGLSANLSTLSTTINEDSGKIGTLETNYATYKAEVDKYVADLGTTTQTANDAMSKVTSVEATASGISTSVTAVEKNLRDNYYNKTTTDDKLATVANNASTALSDAVRAMQAQVDGKIETWANYGVPTASNKPASDWTTTDLKNAHVGDIYYDTNTGKVYEYQKSGNNYFWNTTQTASGIQNALTAAQDANTLADTKKQIFTSQPTTANDYYNVGDLWVNATYPATSPYTYQNDLLRCKTAKAKGDEFSIDHWEKASKYTDDSKATEVANDLHGNYYTIAQTNSKITQTSEAITTEVNKKVGADEIISKINQSAESVSILANKIDLRGYTTINGNFAIDNYGRLRIQSADWATVSDGKSVLSINPSSDSLSGIDLYDSGDAYFSSIQFRRGVGAWPNRYPYILPSSDDEEWVKRISPIRGIMFYKYHSTKRNVDGYNRFGEYTEARIDCLSSSGYWGTLADNNRWDDNRNMCISDNFNLYAYGSYQTESSNYHIGNGIRIALNSAGEDKYSIGCFAIMGKNHNGPLFTIVDKNGSTIPSGQDDYYSSFCIANLFGDLNMGDHVIRNVNSIRKVKTIQIAKDFQSDAEIWNGTMNTSIRNPTLMLMNGNQLARCMITVYGIYFQRRASTSSAWETKQSLTMYDKSLDNP